MKSTDAQQCAAFNRSLQVFLEFGESYRVEVITTVLLRLAVDLTVGMVGRERAPHLLSKFINEFL